MNTTSITVAQLKRAIEIKEQIETLQGQLATILGGSEETAASAKGKMSAQGRARIAAAQKARWAKLKVRNTKPAPTKSATVPKRTMSNAARAKIAAAARARWKKAKASGKTSL